MYNQRHDLVRESIFQRKSTRYLYEKEYVYLDDLSVAEKYRSQGIGSALIHEAEGYAKDIGIQHILLHVEKSNTKAFQLYERLGYKVYRDDGNRYMMIND
ncbi:MAG: GNAT family N-acetyltransferase [Lachnospiraceae bacterium]|nr:GNAT family N-acetyltransferase [Lachnospiraceae bacterium]